MKVSSHQVQYSYIFAPQHGLTVTTLGEGAYRTLEGSEDGESQPAELCLGRLWKQGKERDVGAVEMAEWRLRGIGMCELSLLLNLIAGHLSRRSLVPE